MTVIGTITLVCCSVATGHQDALVKVSRSGQLVALPEEYQPARLHIPSKQSQHKSNVTLRLGASVVEFPPCISRLFYEVKKRQIRVTASWYHDPELLPYYLVIRLSHERSKHAVRGWSLMIDLETAELLRLSELSITNDGNGQRSEEVDVSSICTQEETEQLASRRAPSNNALKLAVRSVTLRAAARRAPDRPAA